MKQGCLSLGHTSVGRRLRLVNHGNTCFLGSVMQFLSSVTSFVKYFTESAYCKDIYPMSKYGNTFAREEGTTLKLMNIESVFLFCSRL